MPSLLAQLWSLHLATTLALAGALWVVQLAVYPLFAAVGREGFSSYHRRYTRRIGIVVAPLMVLEAGTAGILWVAGFRSAAFSVSLGLLAVVWISTFVIQVPLHRQLSRGFDAARQQRLEATNWIRTLAWTMRAGLVLLITP